MSPVFWDFQTVIRSCQVLEESQGLIEKVPEVPTSALTRSAVLLSVLHNLKSCLKNI